MEKLTVKELGGRVAVFGFLAFAITWTPYSARSDVLGWSVGVSPPSPSALQPVYARVMNTQTCLIDPQTLLIRQDGSTVRITVRAIPGCLSTGGGDAVDVSMGSFPPGNFTVVVADSGGLQLTAANFVVVDNHAGKTAPFPLVDYSDHWWDSHESGWGMSIVQHTSDQLFAVWFVYNSANQPTWYTLQPGRWTSSTVFTGPVYKTTGPYFGTSFDPNLVTASLAGTATLSFSGPSSGVFTYNIEGVSNTKPISRLPF